MATPRMGYFNAAGQRIPSVSTILASLGWKTDGLMYWAWNQGRDGKDFRETKQASADVGTVAHAMVQARNHGRDWMQNGEDEETVARALRAFEQYEVWAASTSLQVIATEVLLVSEEHQFGGTPDAIAVARGALTMPDWKTGGAVYTEAVLQVAAYVHAAEEVMGEKFTGGAHLCRFDQEAGGFMHRWIPREALGPAWRVFLRLRDIHDQRRTLEKLCR